MTQCDRYPTIPSSDIWDSSKSGRTSSMRRAGKSLRIADFMPEPDPLTSIAVTCLPRKSALVTFREVFPPPQSTSDGSSPIRRL